MDIKSITIDGITITRAQFEHAKASGIVRWASYSEGRHTEEPCWFCAIFNHTKIHDKCPVYDGLVPLRSCCAEWSEWSYASKYYAENPHRLGNATKEAKAMLSRIESLDWNTWALKHISGEELVDALRVGDIFYSSTKYGLTGVFKVTHDITMPPPKVSYQHIGNDDLGVFRSHETNWTFPIVLVEQLFSFPYSGKNEYSLRNGH